MRLVWKILAVLVAGSALGVLATWLAASHGASGNISDGPWKTNLTVGSPRSDPYLRAFVAVRGLFALTRSEAIYYTANADRDGRQLDGNCRYQLAGRDPDARWWSITAYGPDDYLIANPANRYSVSKTAVARDASGDFAIQIARDASGDNAIPVGTGPFSLTLRLYNPGPGVLLDPAHAELPSLRRASCP